MNSARGWAASTWGACPTIALAFPVVIGESIFRGAGVIVRKAVNIGRDSLIKAGRVVRRDVADRSFVLSCEVTVPGRICQ